MPVLMADLYDALKAAGTPEDKARSAAAEAAAYENRIASVESKLNVLTWMVGTNIVLTAALLVKMVAP